MEESSGNIEKSPLKKGFVTFIAELFPKAAALGTEHIPLATWSTQTCSVLHQGSKA